MIYVVGALVIACALLAACCLLCVGLVIALRCARAEAEEQRRHKLIAQELLADAWQQIAEGHASSLAARPGPVRALPRGPA